MRDANKIDDNVNTSSNSNEHNVSKNEHNFSVSTTSATTKLVVTVAEPALLRILTSRLIGHLKLYGGFVV